MKSLAKFTLTPNLLQFFQMQKHMNLHDKRIQNVRPTIKAPREPTNRSCNHIKKQPLAQFNRIVTIDIENKALLKKLTDKSPSRIGRQKPYKLIKNNRKKNLEEYEQNRQNQGLLKRIKQAKSSYLNCKFASDRKVTQSYINTISKFGFGNMPPNKTLMLPFRKRYRFTKPQHKQSFSLNTTEHTFKKGRKQSEADLAGFSNNIENEQMSSNKIKLIQNLPLTILKGNMEQTVSITYIVWDKKIIVQIDSGNADSMSMELPKNIFGQFFGQDIRTVHQHVKFSEEENCFYINLGKAGRQRYQKQVRKE